MKKNKWIHLGICIGVALAVFLIGGFTQGLFKQTNGKEAVRILSDCFLFPGVLLGGIGALSYIASEGNFDMLGYGFSFFFAKLFHPQKSFMGFYEYKVLKSEKKSGWLIKELLVGLFCMAASAVCAVIYVIV